MIARVAKKFKFDGAHFLPHYEGICKNMHGHTWYVEVEILGEVKETGPFMGMVMDFSEFKTLIGSEIKLLDHTEFNKTLANPTAENLASFFHSRVMTILERQFNSGESQLELIGITVWESPDSYAKVLTEDNCFKSIVEERPPNNLPEDKFVSTQKEELAQPLRFGRSGK